MQQRSVPQFALSLLEQFGSEMRHGDADILFMDKAAKRRLQRAVGGRRALRMIEPILDVYAVVEGDTVITVAHKTQRFRRDTKRARARFN
jgi:hypothetical protein